MSTSEGISVVWEAPDGTLLDLTTTLVDFERMRLREEKIIQVKVHNRSGKNAESISLEAVAHPTAQLGRAQDTYDVMDMSLTNAGPWVDPLTIASMAIDQEIDIYLRWTMPQSAIPGFGQFAIKATGEIIL